MLGSRDQHVVVQVGEGAKPAAHGEHILLAQGVVGDEERARRIKQGRVAQLLLHQAQGGDPVVRFCVQRPLEIDQVDLDAGAGQVGQEVADDGGRVFAAG